VLKDPKNPGGVDTVSSLFGLAGTTQGGFYKILDRDLQATLVALADTSKLEVLSRPSILTRNNEIATITVGKRIPMITDSRTTTLGETINTIQWRDVGIILSVTPHITPNNVVEMALTPEISNLSGETVQVQTGVNLRVITIRSADTLVAVESGKTVVIGGMMEDNVTETVHKIPLLGDIPLAGALFRHTVKSKSKTELLIFLTPLVVQGSEALRASSSSEAGRTELAPGSFTDKQMDKFLDQPGVFSKKEVDKSQEKVVKKKGAFKRFWGWMTDWGLQ
jgi:general secretion pathway protein D